jgi:hypothetical protein
MWTFGGIGITQATTPCLFICLSVYHLSSYDTLNPMRQETSLSYSPLSPKHSASFLAHNVIGKYLENKKLRAGGLNKTATNLPLKNYIDVEDRSER